jgi:putative permease
MMHVLKHWYDRYLSDPEAVFLLVFIMGISLSIWLFGDILAPVLASVVIAYVLDWMVVRLQRRGIPRSLGIGLVFLFFLGLIVVLSLWIIPLLARETASLFEQLPAMYAEGQQALFLLPERYPEFISQEQVYELTALGKSQISALGQQVLSFSLDSIMTIMTMIVYMVVVPLVVFFFMKDRDAIIKWCGKFLPQKRKTLNIMWEEIDAQMGNYIRGKIAELVIVIVMTYITFALFGLEYAFLLSVLVGISIFIPYIGGIVVTIPIIAIAFFQWGFTAHFAWLIVAYIVTQLIDGNIVVPLLFSEAMDMHPVVIILSIIVFGGLWGFWGLFFAIPLAILVKTLIDDWPVASVPHKK